MNKIISIAYRLCFLLCIPFLTGCTDSDADSLPRLFKPSEVKVYESNNGLMILWNRSTGSVAYEIDLAKNEAFVPIEEHEEIGAEEFVATIRNLEEETTYYVRLRGLGNTPEQHSHYVYASGETGRMPSIFKKVPYEEMGYTSVTLRWEEPEPTEAGEYFEADELILITNTEERVIELTADLLAAKAVYIEGLSSGVTYRAHMMNDGDMISYIEFTMPEKPAGAIEINNSHNFKEIVESASDGATIILEGGQIYNYSTSDVSIDKNLTIMGAPGASHPVIYIQQFVLGGEIKRESEIDLIRFSHVELSGMKLNGEEEVPISGAMPNSRAFGFDLSAKNEDGINIGRNIRINRFSLEDCTIRNFAESIVRVNWSINPESSIYFEEIYVNNLLAYDLGRCQDGVQSFIFLNSNAANTGIHCEKYTILNSTFFHLTTGLIEARKWDGQTDAPPTVQVTNCTFDKIAVAYPHASLGTSNSSRVFFNFNNFSMAKVSMTNCVFGEVPTDWSILLKPIVFDGAEFSSCVNSYICTDTQFTDMTPWIGQKQLTADEIFPNRNQFDFTIAESALIIGAGDPRWME